METRDAPEPRSSPSCSRSAPFWIGRCVDSAEESNSASPSRERSLPGRRSFCWMSRSRRLDPATRQVLRRELRELHEREGITTLQVTHDFDEALRLGDLVAVLSEGRIAQSGTPEEVFRYPNSAFVARFVGTGNVIAGMVRRNRAGRESGSFQAQFQGENIAFDVVAEREGPIHAVIRPEDIVLSLVPVTGSARNHMDARVTRLERSGPVTLVHLDVGRPLIASVTTVSADEMNLHPGMALMIAFKATAIHLV